MSKMTDGYIYCFSNPCMPGILKVGMTNRTPVIRLGEANASDTWRPPSPYKIEFSKKVSDASAKENTLHTLLEQYTERIHPRREFFRVSPEEVRKFFDLMDGEMWVETRKEEGEEEEEEEGEEEEEEEGEEDTSSDSVPRVKPSGVKGCRDMAKCFTNGQRIRHTIGINKTWVGTYDSSKNGIVYDGKILTLNKFAVSHFKSERPDRVSNVNAWKECECEVDGKWISTYSLAG
jgi:hypothetical protein